MIRSLWDSKIRARGGLLQRDRPSPGASEYEHPEGSQAVGSLGLDLYMWLTYRTFRLEETGNGCAGEISTASSE